MAESDETDFRYSGSSYVWAKGIVAMIIVLIGTSVSTGPAWPWPIALLLVGAISAAEIGHDRLRQARGRVSLSANGLVSRNWLARETEMAWAEVTRLDVRGAGWRFCRCGSWYHRLVFHGAGRRLRVGPHLERADALVAEAVARAGLTEQSVHWWGTAYRRPAQHTNPV
jgi:hypothetical protein